MTNNQIFRRVVTAALALLAVASCTPAAKQETKLAATDSVSKMTDSVSKMPMSQMAMEKMPMAQMMTGCPLALPSLALTPAQKATFDSVRTEHRAAMQRDMTAAMARARAVLTDAQRIHFDSAVVEHTAMMAKMMTGGGCM